MPHFKKSLAGLPCSTSRKQDTSTQATASSAGRVRHSFGQAPHVCRAQPGAEHSWPSSNGNCATAANPKAQSASPRMLCWPPTVRAELVAGSPRSTAASPCRLHLPLAQTAGPAPRRLRVLDRALSPSRSCHLASSSCPCLIPGSAACRSRFFAKHRQDPVWSHSFQNMQQNLSRRVTICE